MRKRKRVLSILLALFLLTACGGSPIEEEPENLPEAPPAEEAISLPESRRLEPISAPAIVTEGREPAEDYALPPSPADPRYNAHGWIRGGVVGFLTEAPEADAAELNGRTFAMLGRELVEIDSENLDLESASFGMIAGFSTEDWAVSGFRAHSV